MKYIITIICCIISLLSYSQDSMRYMFIVKNPIIFDTVSNAYVHMNLEFSYQRVYTEKNIFSEKGLFTRNKNGNTTTTFKKLGNIWYLKSKSGKWTLFYSDSCKIMPSPEIIIAGKKYIVNWIEKDTINDREVPIFVFKPVGFTVDPQPRYYFDVSKGVIALKVDETMLIRSDVLKSISPEVR